MKDIDHLLRADAARALPDDGFSARVLARLPARAPRERAWLRPALVLGSAALGSALAVAFAPAGLLQGFAELARLREWSGAALAALALPAALLVSAIVVATDLD